MGKLTPHNGRMLTTQELGWLYSVNSLTTNQVLQSIKFALEQKKPLSLIRAGDIMANTLAKDKIQSTYNIDPKMSKYAGLPNVIDSKIQNEIAEAIRNTDILGVINFYDHKPTKLLPKVLNHYNIKPKSVTSALCMRELYLDGNLTSALSGYKVYLVGRQAIDAAPILRKKYKINVVGVADLKDYSDLDRVYNKLTSKEYNYDALLVAAGVPARVLCPRLAKERNVVALDIGHVMDEIIYPGVISDHSKRGKVVNKWWSNLNNKK